MKKQIVIILWLLLFFGALSPLAEAAVTDGKVQYYYESSTSISTSHSSSSITKASASLHSESGAQLKAKQRLQPIFKVEACIQKLHIF